VYTRENLWAIPSADYSRVVFEAVDPMAELALVTYTYNRGIWGFCGTGTMAKMDQVVTSTDVVNDFGLQAMFNHVLQIRAIVVAMNAETANVYDAQLTWDEIELFMNQAVRKYYGRGYPTKDEWFTMMQDLKVVFDALAVHWGGDTISYRYDFLTFLRVMKHYLKTPTIPRPTTTNWRFRVEAIDSKCQ
jgi:hypothetical protein